MQQCKQGSACIYQHSTCVFQHTVQPTPPENAPIPTASYEILTKAMCATLQQSMAPLVAMLTEKTATIQQPQQQPLQATVVRTTTMGPPPPRVTFQQHVGTPATAMPLNTNTEEMITPAMMTRARQQEMLMYNNTLQHPDANLDYDEDDEGATRPPFSLLHMYAVVYTSDEYQLSILVSCFSRAFTFQRVPILSTTYHAVQHIVRLLIAASPFSYENVCQNTGFCVYVQLYIRLHCTPGNILPELFYQLDPDTHKAGIYYLPRTTSTQHVHTHHGLDHEQVTALAFALHHYNTDIPSLHNMKQHLFLDSFSAYFKHAPFMRMTNECLLTYRSPDYLPEFAFPLRQARRGPHIIVQTLHPLYTNWAAMLQRTSTPHTTHHNVQVEPCWTGCFWPGHCVSKDKLAFFSYVIWVDYILGTKPNHSHSSSSLFCVDRINNALHYSIDNIRWASNATNFWNIGPTASNSVVSSLSHNSILDLRRLRDVFRKLKRT
jgi:hypothetical protein